MSDLRRRGLAALLIGCATAPAMAAAQDQCRAIRALTNMDGRGFADLAVGFARNPYRMSVRIGRAEALPTPEDCSLSADESDLELVCYWRPGDFSANNACSAACWRASSAASGTG
ncbi:MAG TPA: hypothetical protein VMG08_00225 [Allosphingosinicella sp.]|nr:hypothetical protein [Allosphingosinicella sp.]